MNFFKRKSKAPLIAAITPPGPVAIGKFLEEAGKKPEPTEVQKAALDAYARKNASQITFYPYDRGQCFDKGNQAVMAFVNVPGACSHYIWSTIDRTWEFVELPHMSTEQRCAERMGYMSITKMQATLFPMFDQWLKENGFKPDTFTAYKVEDGHVSESKRSGALRDVEDFKTFRRMLVKLSAGHGFHGKANGGAR